MPGVRHLQKTQHSREFCREKEYERERERVDNKVRERVDNNVKARAENTKRTEGKFIYDLFFSI